MIYARSPSPSPSPSHPCPRNVWLPRATHPSSSLPEGSTVYEYCLRTLRVRRKVNVLACPVSTSLSLSLSLFTALRFLISFNRRIVRRTSKLHPAAIYIYILVHAHISLVQFFNLPSDLFQQSSPALIMNHTLSVTAANKLTVEKFALYTNVIYNIHFYLSIYI